MVVMLFIHAIIALCGDAAAAVVFVHILFEIDRMGKW